MLTGVLVYTKNKCQACRATKRLLEEREVEFTEINVEENPEIATTLKNEGWQSMPVVKHTSGAWAGFQHDKLLTLK